MRDRHYDILLVEDDTEDRMILKDAFAEQDCAGRMTAYDSGFDFLQQFGTIRRFSPPPVLIILDYNLNGANADLLLQRIKTDVFLKKVPVIIYTSFCTTKLHDELLDKGAFDCIEKGNSYQKVLDFAAGICNHFWQLKKADNEESNTA